MRTTHGKEYHNWNNSQDDFLKLKVISVRYYETRRGTGYQCKTNKKNVEIWNDGNGGGTYIAPHHPYTKPYNHMTEKEMKNLINKYEEMDNRFIEFN